MATAGATTARGVAILDWVLVGILAAAIGELFDVQALSPAPADGTGRPVPYVRTFVRPAH